MKQRGRCEQSAQSANYITPAPIARVSSSLKNELLGAADETEAVLRFAPFVRSCAFAATRVEKRQEGVFRQTWGFPE